MIHSTPKFNPFPGLRPFTQDEDHLFFGREEQTLELLQRLGSRRFVAVVGTSGSGKSSLVRCGLLSELLGGKMLGAGAAWEVAVTHPGGNPLGLLTEALLDADLYDRRKENARENLLATLSRSHFGLVEAVKQSGIGEDTNFLLVVDQFEEVFRFHETGQAQQEIANEFVSLLLEAAAQKQVPIYVVLTMRSDFIGECGQFEGLAEAVSQGEFLIPRLTREQYKRVIEGPIKVAGGQISPRLLQRLLNDLSQQADQLPCLQHALMRTWTVWSAKGDSEALDLEDYQRVGRMAEALSLHADEIYDSLADDGQRELCRGMFQALTVQESENRGIRRPQRLSSLCQILEVNREELAAIIDAFRQPGVTFLMPSAEVELTDQTIIDISHESLMRVWTRLRYWVEEEAQAAGIYRRLSESAALHRHREAGLYRDPELGIALAWRDSKRPNRAWAERYLPGFAEAMAFLEESRHAAEEEERQKEAARQHELDQAQQLAQAQQERIEQQHRAARRQRATIAALAAVALLAVAACVSALRARANAKWHAEMANLQATAARENGERARRALIATEQALADVEREKKNAEQNLRKAEAAESEAQQAERRSREFRYATDMQLAARLIAVDDANAGQVLDRLADHDPEKNPDLKGKDDLRGFEWHYLKRLIDSRAAIFPGGDEPVFHSTLTAEGELITLDSDGRLQRWDAKTRCETRQVMDLKRGRNLGSKTLSPDGRRAALAIDGKVYVVDTATGEEVIPAIAAQARVGLIFSPDNRMLVTVDATIGWWNAAAGTPIAVQESKLQGAGPVSISSDGLTVAVGGQTVAYSWNSFSVFRLDPDAREITLLLDKQNANIASTRTAAISPDGSRLAVSQYFSGTVTLFDTLTGRILTGKTFDHASSVSAIGFNPQGDSMVTASLDGSIKVWPDYMATQPSTIQTGKTPSSMTTSPDSIALLGHTEEVTRVAFGPSGKQVISSSRDKTSRLWDLTQKTASLHRTLDGFNAVRVRYSPDGLLLAAADFGNVRLRDAVSGQVVRELSRPVGHNFPAGLTPDSVAFSADNRMLAVGYGGAKDLSLVELWDIDSGELLAVLPGTTDIPNFSTTELTGVVSALAFSPDGKFLVAGFGSLTQLPLFNFGRQPLKVYDVAARRTLRLLEGHENFCVSVAFSPDGSRMASGCYDGTARVWDAATWKTLHVLQNPDPHTAIGHGRVLDVEFSPRGDLLATASHERNVHIWNAATGEHLHKLHGHANGVSSVAFSPDGHTLASGSYDGTVRLWNTATWRELMSLDPGGAFHPWSLAFSPDGSQLLAASAPAVLWSTRPDDEAPPEELAQRLATLFPHANAEAQSPKSKVQSQEQTSLDFATGTSDSFTSRVRMLSENLRLHESLEKLSHERPDNELVQAALAAARANWHASRQEWKLAVEQICGAGVPPAPETQAGRLHHNPAPWLRTPGLLRLATALVHQDRPAEAGMLLTGGEQRRAEDGNGTRSVTFGLLYTPNEYPWKVIQVFRGSPAWLAGLRAGDLVLRHNDVEVTAENILRLGEFLQGGAGSKATLVIQHPEQEETKTVELTKASYIQDEVTNLWIEDLLAAVDQKLAVSPDHAGLLELRAELAGQWSDYQRQVTDYTAAIDTLRARGDHKPGSGIGENSDDKPVAEFVRIPGENLQRLYCRRGNAYLGLKQWQQARDDYARGITPETVDEALLANQASAQAELMLASEKWTVLKPVEAKSELGATLSILPDDSILASGADPLNDRYRVVDSLEADIDLAAVRLEALTHPSLPGNGPGRYPGRGGGLYTGTFAQTSWTVTATSPDESDPVTIVFDKAADDRPIAPEPIKPNGAWNIWGGGEGRDCTAIFSMPAPLPLVAGTTLTFEMHLKSFNGIGENLGHFRLSLSGDPAAFDQEQKRFAARKLTNAWLKLATAYRIRGDQTAIEELVERRPKLAGPVGDLYTQGKTEEQDLFRAVEIYSKGIAAGQAFQPDNRQAAKPDLHDVELLSKRARAYESLMNWSAAAADWARIAAGNPDGAKLIAEFARRVASGGEVALAQAQFDASRALYEHSLEVDAENDLTAAELAQLLVDQAQLTQLDWVRLKPAETKTESGATLTLQDDGSVQVGWASPTTPDESMVGIAHPTRWRPGPMPLEAFRIESNTSTVPSANGAAFFSEYQIVAASMASQAGALKGRFVRLDLPGDNNQFPRLPVDGGKKTINLAELQVFHGDQNIALKKKVRQSSSSAEARFAPEGALDGHTVGTEGGNPYAHTLMEDNPWWEVDLASEQAIDRIVIWNRSDPNLYARMNHFRVRVLDRSRKVVFERVVGRAPSPSMEIVRPVYLVQSNSEPAAEDQPLILRLPLIPLKDSLLRIRVSVATSLPDIGREEKHLEAMKIADVSTRLATAYALDGEIAQATRWFGKSLEAAQTDDDAGAVVEQLEVFDEVLTALLKLSPEDPRLQFALALSHARRGREELDRHHPAEALAVLQKARVQFTALMGRYPKTHWTILKPVALKSRGGATLTLEDDGSLLAGGTNPDRDQYTLSAQTDLEHITAIRLEALPDPSLPRNGPGRDAGTGNFHLNELKVFSAGVPAPLTNILVAYDQGHGFRSAIDGQVDSLIGWSNYPRAGQQNTAFIATQLKRAPGDELKIEMYFSRGPWTQHNLGRFRLSVTGDPDPLDNHPLLWDRKADGLADLDVAIAKAQAQQGQVSEAVAALAEALDRTENRENVKKIIDQLQGLDDALSALAILRPQNADLQLAVARRHVERGQELLAQQRPADALAELKQARAICSGLSAVRMRLDLQDSELADLDIAIAKAQAQQGELSEAAAALAEALGRTEKRKERPKAIQAAAAQAGVLEKLIELRAGNGPFEDALAQYYSDRGESRLARESAARARTWYEKQLESEPGNLQLARDLADLLLDEDMVFEREATRVAARTIMAPWPRLGAAYYCVGDEAASRDAFSRALELASDERAKAEVARLAAPFEPVFAGLLAREPESAVLRLAQARYLAPKRLAENQFQEAVTVASQALKISPDDLDLLLWRAEAQMKLRHWSTAIEDYSRVIERRTDASQRRAAELARAEAQLRLGQWSEAAELYTQEMFLSSSWDGPRDSVAAQLLAGNAAVARTAATRLFQIIPTDSQDASWANILVSDFIAIPGMITPANQARLLSAAQTAGGESTGLLTAAIQYRLGHLKEATPLLSATSDQPQFVSLAAMLLYERGETKRGHQYLQRAANWFQQQRDKDPGSVIPGSQAWQDWSVRLALWREATRKLAGSRPAELDSRLNTQPAGAGSDRAGDKKP